MKTRCWIASTAGLLVSLPLAAAASETFTNSDKVSVAVRREATDSRSGVIPAGGRRDFVVPEPDTVAPVDFQGTLAGTPRFAADPSSDGFEVEGEAFLPKCPGYPVATHLTASGSGEQCCPDCGGSCCGQSRAHCGQGWWRGRIKPCLQCSHWGYADLFEEPSAGAAVSAHIRTQVMRGMHARMVLYRYDFYDAATAEAARLNPHGERRLREIARMAHCFGVHPIRIEPVPERPALSTARRDHVLQRLQQSVFALPEEWVVVGRPDTPGLAGQEAVEIHTNLIKQTTSGPGGRSQYGEGSGISVGVLGVQPSGSQ